MYCENSTHLVKQHNALWQRVSQQGCMVKTWKSFLTWVGKEKFFNNKQDTSLSQRYINLFKGTMQKKDNPIIWIKYMLLSSLPFIQVLLIQEAIKVGRAASIRSIIPRHSSGMCQKWKISLQSYRSEQAHRHVISRSRKLYLQYPLIIPIQNHKSGTKPSQKHSGFVAFIRVVPS